MKAALSLTFVILWLNQSFSQQVLLKAPVNLRHGSLREWVTFPEKGVDSMLSLSFDAHDPGSSVLSLDQFDVTHDWTVTLNNKPLGNLVVDEQRMTSLFDIPANLLKSKNNKLVIVPPKRHETQPDDITIANVMLHKSISYLKPVQVTVKSEDRLVPSRLTILNDRNALQPVKTDNGDTLAVRTGIIYSLTGVFTFSLPAGNYKIFASRGFEYSVDSVSVNITHGLPSNRTIALSLNHDIDLNGLQCLDTHVHTKEYSGHGDATMKERLITIAGEGLDYAVTTEHNQSIDGRELSDRIGASKWFTLIRGDELTTKVGHFNIFPLTDSSVPNANGISWNDIAAMKKLSKRVVILNHARDEHNGFRPADTIFKVSPANFPANAMEVLNSGSQQTDPRQLYNDWMRLMVRGIFLSPVGSSDSHDVSRFIVGQGRTYIHDQQDVADNFIAGKTAVSFGLLPQLDVDTRTPGKLNVIVKVYSPSWIKPGNISIYVNGQKIYAADLSDVDRQVGNYYSKELSISRPPGAAAIVAIAEGADPKAPWWPIARPYQHASPELNPIVLGISEVTRLP